MKLPLILLFACNALALAAERPNGFLGIQWGASPEEAKRVLQKRPGVVFPGKCRRLPHRADRRHFCGSAGRKMGDRISRAQVRARQSSRSRPRATQASVYKEFRTQLVSKYGSPTVDRKTGGTTRTKARQPQAAGTTAIWKFTPTMKDKSQRAHLRGTDRRRRERGDETQGSVTIKYVNETLTGTAAVAAGKGTAKPSLPPVKKEEL